MALKDTLERRQRELASTPTFDKAAVIAEWRNAVNELMDEMENFLGEYRDAGTLVFERSEAQITEEALGTYRVSQMTLRAGPAVVMFQPIGRMIIGATGRVDLYRQGHGNKNERVMALRGGPDSDWRWTLSIPPKENSFQIMKVPALVQSLQRTSAALTKESIETALDQLLQ